MVRMGFPVKFVNFMDQINRFPIDLELVKLNELKALSKIYNYSDDNPRFKFRHMSRLVQEAAEYRKVGRYMTYDNIHNRSIYQMDP
jgi:hypothetical protein